MGNICNLNGLENLSLLQILLLNNNEIHTVSSLQPLRSLQNLNHLTIYNNPICCIPHFSLIIKQIVSKSTILDQKLFESQSLNHFSEPNESKLKQLQNENKKLKTNW